MAKSKRATESSIKKAEEAIGLDQDEQAMNGEYGMVETIEEDRANDRDGNNR
ncbi:DUF4021 domain-containing protein [Aquibacillus kalidii]|uniref:DUF4021 domain-containing protein n=1 Tax=Aquibacillus kalidii TaxID=2762597 RepID=UPI001644050B|nr:DUF4021 domain-containing protein [Aquibacillus kalidii]